MPDPNETVTVTPASDVVQPVTTEPAKPVEQPAPIANPAAPEAKTEQKPAEGGPFTSILADDPAADKQEGDKSAESEDKPDGDDPAADFDIKLPDGFVADEAAVGYLKEKVKAGNLTGEQAQEMADQYMAAVQRLDESRIGKGQEIIKGWHKEIESNQDFGGAKFKESVENGKLVLHKYGSPRLVKEFTEMGVLDHPEFIYMLNRLHADVSDGVSLGGSSEATPERDPAHTMFPDFE